MEPINAPRSAIKMNTPAPMNQPPPPAPAPSAPMNQPPAPLPLPPASMNQSPAPAPPASINQSPASLASPTNTTNTTNTTNIMNLGNSSIPRNNKSNKSQNVSLQNMSNLSVLNSKGTNTTLNSNVNSMKNLNKNTSKNTSKNTGNNTVNKNTSKNTMNKNTGKNANMNKKMIEGGDNALDKFINNINSIYELVNSNKETTAIFNVSVLSKQYLAYYLYRIFTKFISAFENAIPSKDIRQLMKYLRIPADHDRIKPYPLSGIMTNDERILDLIILSMLDMFMKVNEYIQGLPNTSGYDNIFKFLDGKPLATIIEDLVDLQKLVPGISVAAVRPNYLDDQEL